MITINNMILGTKNPSHKKNEKKSKILHEKSSQNKSNTKKPKKSVKMETKKSCKMITKSCKNDNKKLQKSGTKKNKKYNCKFCDYSSNNKYNFNKHLLTPKHNRKKLQLFSAHHNRCKNCGKVYRWASGLSAHKKKCYAADKLQEKMITKSCKKKMGAVFDSSASAVNDRIQFLEKCVKELSIDKTIIQEDQGSKSNKDEMFVSLLKGINEVMLKQTNILQTMLPKMDTVQHISNICQHNTIEQNVSIHVYLNENCKDAMRLSKFIENIKISNDDLKYTKDHGYTEGVTNILKQNLLNLLPTQRPIHCCDAKRLKFYIKEDTWERDTNEKVDKVINNVSIKQILQLKEWEKAHPNFLSNDETAKEWNEIVSKIMGGNSGDDVAKNAVRIKRKLAANVILPPHVKS